MGILEALKNIFDTKFSNILNNNKFVLFDFSKNTENTLEIKKDGTLSIDLSKVSAEERKKIKEQIIDVSIQNENETFLLDESKNKTTSIKANLPKDSDKKILEFYHEKLRPDWNKALEMSLVVKNMSQKGEDIKDIKRDIRKKYPEFGNNLCNMVGREYFHEHFKQLHKSMLEEDFDIVEYRNKVEKIVKSLPYTVFIDQYKGYDDFAGEIFFKLSKLKKYGTGKLLLHGLGKNNVKTTLKLIEKERDTWDITDVKIELNKNKTIITATLYF
ncbi:hypothetical protein HN827_08735 [archaeon]|jgi:hypothetical protein|nr:hypothetical protein [archaeon]MBT4021810.1 hypothetical protein [archaeon]MBT4271775.1 hypothetical protein [archaeon]MBT4461419.1 hypothetical protein [archaeon]MBT6772837.1 hypothetical protein [archaeon]